MGVFYSDEFNYWYYRGKYKNKITGKRINYQKSGFKTQKQAIREEAKFLELVDTSEAGMTFNVLKDFYLKEAQKENKKSTIVTDEVCIDKHIVPTFGSMRIVTIRSSQIMQWQTGLIEKGYSNRYVNKNHEVLSKILNFAMLHFGLPTNEAKKVKKLKQERKESTKMYWEPSIVYEFLSQIENDEMKLFYKLLFITGMRIGEFVALKVADFKDSSYLDVTKTLTYKTGGNGYEFTKPKSARSIRRVYLDEASAKELRVFIEAKKNIYGYNEEFFIFGNSRPYATTNIARKMDRYIDLMNQKRIENKQKPVERITPHGLRHSLASYLINENENDSVVADRLGHTVDELHSTYSHVFKSKKIELTKSLSKLHSFESSQTPSQTLSEKSA